MGWRIREARAAKPHGAPASTGRGRRSAQATFNSIHKISGRRAGPRQFRPRANGAERLVWHCLSSTGGGEMKAGSAYVQREAERLGIIPPAPDERPLMPVMGLLGRSPISPGRKRARSAIQLAHFLAREVLGNWPPPFSLSRGGEMSSSDQARPRYAAGHRN